MIDLRLIVFTIGLLSITIPLLSIVFSAILSGWFDLIENALSDLGHALNSNVAWIFNLGLATGGSLIIVFSSIITKKLNFKISILMMIIGYFLILIAVFDEVYGVLHFIVSFVFFVLLMAFIVLYSISVLRRITIVILAFLLLVINLLIWIVHLVNRVPRGAALPELVSIIFTLPFYFHLVYKASK